LGFRDPQATLWTATVQTLKFCEKTGKVNQGLESQTPPYLSNGDRLREFFCTIVLRTLENGGVGHLQIPKKKPQQGQNAHVNQNPKSSISCKSSIKSQK